MRIIPAIDLIDGKCVRLEKGNYHKKKIYNEDPLEVAYEFEDNGIRDLHLVDLDGAKAGHVIHQKILERIKIKTSLHVDYGGGIRSEKDIRSLFDSGADQINIGSLAIKKPEVVRSFFHIFDPRKIILSPDVIDKKIAIHGWQEQSDKEIFDFIREYTEVDAKYYVCTDIEKDGMLTGSSIALYQEIVEKFKDIELIASGGISSINELEELSELNINGAIIGKAIYENRIKLSELKRYVS